MSIKSYGIAGAVLFICACHSKDSSKEEPKPNDAPSRDAIELAKSVSESSGIRWAKVERQRLARTIAAPAEVSFDPDRVARVGPLNQGRVARVLVRVGDHVERNAVLAELSSVAGAESRATLTQAQADLELARANLLRQEKLHESAIDTERVHQEAVAAVRRSEAEIVAARQRAGLTGDLTLRTPIAGTVIERRATTGETVGPESSLFTIADLSRVWVIGRVYESDVGSVRVGAKAHIRIDAYPERQWEGPLVYVAGALDHDSRSLPVRVELDNLDGTLRAELFGSLAIEASEGSEGIAVDSGAVQRLEERTVVFVHEDAAADRDRFVIRAVQLGRTLGPLVEVKSGLQAGEAVVTTGSFTLKSQLLRDTLEGE